MVEKAKENAEIETDALVDNACEKAPASAEHARFDDDDEPCDDGRAGKA